MGFGNKGKGTKTERFSGKKKNKTNTPKEDPEDSAPEADSSGFVPSSNEDLKAYRRAGKRRDKERAANKAGRKVKGLRELRNAGEIMDALDAGTTVKIYRSDMFDKIMQACKTNGTKPVAYKEYLGKNADAQFMFDMTGMLSRLSFSQLSWVVGSALRVPVPMRDWSTAYHWAVALIVQVFEVRDYLDRKKSSKGRVIIRDRDALDDWPIPAMKRRAKGTKEEEVGSKGDSTRFRSGKLKAAADGDDDEDDEEDEKKGKEDEDEDEEDEEENEKPKKKAKAKKAKKKAKSKKDDDEDDEDEDEDEEDDEDEDEDEDEEDDEDEDEDEEDDEDEDEDDEGSDVKSKKSKSKKTKSTKAKEKDVAKAKKGGKSKKAEPAKRTRTSDDTKYVVKKVFKGGVRADAQSVIGKTGLTLEEIQTKCKKQFKMEPQKVKGCIYWLRANGYLKIEE